MGAVSSRLLRALRGRASEGAAAAPPPPLPPEGDELEASPPLECTPDEVERWNAEWLAYLGREWQQQLAPHTAYPGCYALSKVLEEVMLEQYGVQYDLDGCCLRTPWIMEKDDFRYQLSFGEDVFGESYSHVGAFIRF